MRTRGRELLPQERARLWSILSEWARSGSFQGLRTRALIFLAASSGLRLKELLALNLDQVLESGTRRGRFRVASRGYLAPKQSKGRRKGPSTGRWDSAGPFRIPKPVRYALRRYLNAALRRGWITLPPEPGAPLFVTIKDHTGVGRHRLGRRAAQVSWSKAQQRAGVRTPYRFHDLRHDAITRFARHANGNAFTVAAFARCDVQTAQRYVHVDALEIDRLSEVAATRPARPSARARAR